MSPPGASPRPNSLTRSPAAPALLRLSEVFLDAGPPHVVRVPTYPPAGKSGHQAEFFARHPGHTLDAGGSFLPCPRHLPALLLVKGFLRQAELASVHRSRHSQQSVFRIWKCARTPASAKVHRDWQLLPCDSAHSALSCEGLGFRLQKQQRPLRIKNVDVIEKAVTTATARCHLRGVISRHTGLADSQRMRGQT